MGVSVLFGVYVYRYILLELSTSYQQVINRLSTGYQQVINRQTATECDE